MRYLCPSLVAVVALGLSAGTSEAMPMMSTSGQGAALPVVSVANGCGPGLVRGRMGTCLKRPAVFSHDGRRIIQKGCGKPIGAGLRTPC